MTITFLRCERFLTCASDVQDLEESFVKQRTEFARTTNELRDAMMKIQRMDDALNKWADMVCVCVYIFMCVYVYVYVCVCVCVRACVCVCMYAYMCVNVV